MKDCEEEVYHMYREAVDEEKDWAKYLFKDGSMIGLQRLYLGQYVEYIANKRLKGIGLIRSSITQQEITHYRGHNIGYLARGLAELHLKRGDRVIEDG